MTNNNRPALTIAETNAEIRRRHAEQADLHALTAKTRAQYDKGLLTLEDLLIEVIAIRNSYHDNPDRGTWVLNQVGGHETCDHTANIFHCDAC